ncbi:MAG TPA: protein kinase [Chthoniobacterales bacterium]|jgi:serine/threonine protein kinase/Tfp pilus assembly protein PilF
MIGSASNFLICEICGAKIETTASGDFGCMACWLRAGLDGTVPNEPETIPDSFGTYRINRHEDGTLWELGHGAMGVTYRAEDVSLRRRVALKLINSDFARHGGEARERFVREARAAAVLRHPNVATVYQFGLDEETGQCFCAIEFVEGETLEERVRRSGPLDVATVQEIARQIVSALVVAEKHQLVHRDLKPANVMIAADDQSGKEVVKIIDFGLAKALGETAEKRILTHGGFLGTPAFASPEQLRRAPVDARSDIYSLGATLWYLLTGQMPFGDAATREPPIEQLKTAHVPAGLISLLVSMLAPEPAARPGVKELSARLESLPRRRSHVTAFAAAGALVVLFVLAFYFHEFPARPKREILPLAKSIAVLPFENLGDEKGDTSFADGVQDELLTDLARISELKVVSRTSVMQYRGDQARNLREIGEQLGVAYIVEGAVQRSGNKVRVTAQLIDARSDLHRWAQTYDRPVDDVFAIQSEIAQRIAEQLHAKIAPHEKIAIEEQPTHDLEAFTLYTEAKLLLATTSLNPRGKRNLLQAAQLLAEAVARDPNFLLAWCLLANAHDSLYFLGLDRYQVRLSLGEMAVDTALRLQPDAGEAHLARARHLYQCYLAYEPALAELEIARRALPNNAGVFTLAGYIYRRQGKWDDSRREFENALALDPRNIYTLQQASRSYALLRRYNDAAIILDRALLVAPANIDLRIARAEIDLGWRADTRPLHALVSTILAKDPVAASEIAGASLFLALCERDRPATRRALATLGDGIFGPDAIQLRPLFWQGLAARASGDRVAAIRAFTAAREEQQRKVDAAPDFAPALSIVGLIDAGLGNKADAIREARRAIEMLPITRDAIDGAHLIENLATVYAWSGEPDLACDQLEAVTKIPGTLSYGQLRLSPLWDDLQGHPRFEKIVGSLAPEVSQ